MRGGRRGFTFVEVLVVSVLIGILAGISVPHPAWAVDRASAATVVSDARTVSLAARQYLEEGDPLPESSDWGETPTGLGGYLPEKMPPTEPPSPGPRPARPSFS